MAITGNYRLKQAFVGFDDDFNNKYMSRDEVLKLDLKKKKDDMEIIAMMFARMECEVTEKEIIFKLDPNFDSIAKKLAADLESDGKYAVIKYTYKKQGKKYAIVSEDGEEEGDVEFKGDTFEFNFSTFEKI